ncbi:hypothetical protein BDZ89DRAFT_705506 [Hymenopellis radicata]|nr:hypothetical protein BDZ89DRAFT_705506 [Hymenopellis radicata]
MLDDQDEDVRIAVRALGDMRNGGGSGGSATPTPTPTPALSIASSSSLPTTSLPSPAPSFSSYQYGDKNDYADDEEEYRREYVSRENDDGYRPNDEADLVERMSHLPLVGGALRAYEQGKASSRVVKYGAEMMESVARPVVGRLQLDEFACRQLDRVSLLSYPFLFGYHSSRVFPFQDALSYLWGVGDVPAS